MFKPFALYIGTRYTNLKQRDHFISFISLVSMLGIALSITVLITVLSVMNGFSEEVRAKILSITPHLTVSNWNKVPLQDWQELRQTLLKRTEVLEAGPFIEGQGMLSTRAQATGILIRGILPDYAQALFPMQTHMLAGSVKALKANQFGAIIGLKLAQALNLEVGDTMTLVIPEVNVSIAGVAPRIKRLKVVGIFDVGYAFDSMYLFIHYQDASKLFKTQGGATGVQAQLRDPFQSPSLVRKMHSVLKHQYSVLDWTAMNQAYFSAVKMEKTMMFFILLLILAIAVFNLISTLVMVVTDKRADIAILRTLGASRGTIMQIFMTQGAIIGFIGTLLGVLFGVLLALNVTDLVNIIQQTFNVEFINQDIYLINFLPAKLLWRDVLLVASCGFGLSLLATIHPAWRASNIQPAEALRYEK